MSRIGKKPVAIPKDVKVEIKDGLLCVEGPKGKLSRPFSERLKMEIKENQVFLTKASSSITNTFKLSKPLETDCPAFTSLTAICSELLSD